MSDDLLVNGTFRLDSIVADRREQTIVSEVLVMDVVGHFFQVL